MSLILRGALASLLGMVLIPVLHQLGINPIHFGILMVMANEVGLLTPPMGVNLFVHVSVEKLDLQVLPYIGGMTLVILLILFCEPVST